MHAGDCGAVIFLEGSMNIERFSETVGAIKDAVGKLEFLLATELKKSESPTVPLQTDHEVPVLVDEQRKVASPTKSLKTEEEVLAAINEKVALHCVPGLWEQVQVSMRAQHQRDERRVWRQIVAAIRANDAGEASRLAKAAGIPTEFLKS
jgi:hypothetical protein